MKFQPLFFLRKADASPTGEASEFPERIARRDPTTVHIHDMSLVSTRVALRESARGFARPEKKQQLLRRRNDRRHPSSRGSSDLSLPLPRASASSSSPSPPSPAPPPRQPLLLRPGPEGPSSPPIVVVALGGNALLRRGEEPTAANQARHAAEAAESIARLFFDTFEGNCRLLITHGNGPQVGYLASSQPLEQLSVLDAETQGAIGLALANGIDRALLLSSASSRARPSSSPPPPPPSPSICLLTRVVVSGDDPAFLLPPTKPIGPGISKERAEEASRKQQQQQSPGGASSPPLTFVEDAATPGLVRRAVPSPAPVSVVEIDSIRKLLSLDPSSSSSFSSRCAVGPVICGGGGGVPVVAVAAAAGSGGGQGEGEPSESLSPVDAVIDKDATSALLASLLGASALLLLTDAEALFDPREWEASKREGRPPTAVASPASPEEVEALLPLLPEGSMRPKAASAARAAREGIVAGIGSLQDAAEILLGTKGTLVVPPPAKG